MNKKLILLQLNELNFDLVKNYAKKQNLENFNRIFNYGIKLTQSEEEYSLLEPWIQWVSVNTGKSANEHKIFRLGDIHSSNHRQIYEIIEEKGYKVGAIIPMNTKNSLLNPAYFISDPWTKTDDSNNFLIKKISKTVSQIVNNNSSRKISISNLFFLLISFIIFLRPKNYFKSLFLIITGLKHKWRWAILLDIFLADLHISLIKKHQPNFSSIFLNCSAHIQHHYLFNSYSSKNKNPSWYLPNKMDPFNEIIKVYNQIIGDHFKLDEYQMIIATGLSQEIAPNIDFFYRLTDHNRFLKNLKIDYDSIYPRMTRDFLIEFKSNKKALEAEHILSSIETLDGFKIFGIIDNRGDSLFVSLTYNREIKDKLIIKSNSIDKKINLKEYTSFVAIKNGNHNSKGYVFFSEGIKSEKNKLLNVKDLFHIILNYFNINY
tara:strand:+ start:802 stop:2097 length:1296 start_codon:yes stop_codon:yes gene_type:complete